MDSSLVHDSLVFFDIRYNTLLVELPLQMNWMTSQLLFQLDSESEISTKQPRFCAGTTLALSSHIHAMDITMKADVPSGVKFDWNHSKAPPRLVLIAESEDFDRNTIKNWKDEGFQIMYIPFSGGKKELVTHMHTISDPLELGETYAIVGERHS